MARIDLFRPFDLTAETSFRNPQFGRNESWLDYADGYRFDFNFGGYDRMVGLTLSQNGQRIFVADGFSLNVAPNAPVDAEAAVRSGSWRPIFDAVLAGNDQINGSSGRDVVDGRGGDDMISGRGGNDVLRGGLGNDTLSGGAGDDLLEGGAGNDLLLAGKGADTIRGGAGIDTLQIDTRADLRVDLAVSKAQGFAGGSVTVEGVENLRGGAGNDRLSGNGQANTIEGGAGNDHILGRGGNDILRGGNGQDVLDGGKGNDRLEGGAGADRLLGGAGNDRLDGGTGNDILTGGAGSDVFVFRSNSGRDVVTDFQDGRDRIMFESGPDSFDDLQIQMRGADTVVRFDDAEITLTGIDQSLIGASDFVFG